MRGITPFAVSIVNFMWHSCYIVSPDCTDGDVLLMNGSTPSVGQAEGRVEVCADDRYWTICDDYWDFEDASVICRQLNFNGTGIHIIDKYMSAPY